MDYHPRYAQPFTLSEAVLLDPSTITEEIGRLENSLLHLRKTQEELQQYLTGPDSESDPDADLQEAFEENKLTIGSQVERISILQMALIQKGVVQSVDHYDGQQPPQRQQPRAHPETAPVPPDEPMQEEDGIHL
ncbi:hypothetical protein DENSPDRAFT_831186 [Dentipellis sp. KUC8613]|nr:hypothetical protein DENSPDRAFT_831186 [Dentipellis sp. KUC8613]